VDVSIVYDYISGKVANSLIIILNCERKSMKYDQQCTSLLVFTMVLSLCLAACTKEKKQGKLEISEQEFTLRQDSDNSFTIDASGKIRNIGEVDVKKVVVTGYCRSCGEEWIPGRWFVSNIEKVPSQKDVIRYIAVGKEESFSFQEITDLLLLTGQDTPEMPENLEVVIESFETVE
jgi:hypothetical protein